MFCEICHFLSPSTANKLRIGPQMVLPRPVTFGCALEAMPPWRTSFLNFELGPLVCHGLAALLSAHADDRVAVTCGRVRTFSFIFRLMYRRYSFRVLVSRAPQSGLARIYQELSTGIRHSSRAAGSFLID